MARHDREWQPRRIIGTITNSARHLFQEFTRSDRGAPLWHVGEVDAQGHSGELQRNLGSHSANAIMLEFGI